MSLNNFTTNSNPNDNDDDSGGGNILQMIHPANDSCEAKDFLINYNDKFKNSSGAMFREDTINQLLSVLIGKTKPNAILVGAAGVGKTKILEDLASKLENKDPVIPASLYGHVIYELPLSNIVADSGIVGQLESKIKSVIAFCSNKDNKAILFIDEIHMLCRDSWYAKIAQIIKPALAKGGVQCIGATTMQEYNDLRTDPALTRRFSKLVIDELTRAQTIEVLKSESQARATAFTFLVE